MISPRRQRGRPHLERRRCRQLMTCWALLSNSPGALLPSRLQLQIFACLTEQGPEMPNQPTAGDIRPRFLARPDYLIRGPELWVATTCCFEGAGPYAKSAGGRPSGVHLLQRSAALAPRLPGGRRLMIAVEDS